MGGNIGGSLLDELPQNDGRDDWVVLEISSFQLWHFGYCTPHAPREESAHGVCRIHVAVVTGCSPNHLDWHASFADYVAAKQRILTGQTPDDFAVLNTFDAEVASWLPLVRGRPIGRWSPARLCRSRTRVCGVRLDDLPPLPVPGEHNRINAACAAAAAAAAGCSASEIRRGLEAFRGLPQRLEWFAVIDGRRFYNDSTATTPESTIAALRSLDVPVWLLAGGKSKGFDFEPLAAEIVAPCPRSGVFRIGSRRNLRELVAAADAAIPLHGRRNDGGGAAIGVGRARGRARPSCCRRPVPAPTSSATSASAASGLWSWCAVGQSAQSLESRCRATVVARRSMRRLFRQLVSRRVGHRSPHVAASPIDKKSKPCYRRGVSRAAFGLLRGHDLGVNDSLGLLGGGRYGAGSRCLGVFFARRLWYNRKSGLKMSFSRRVHAAIRTAAMKVIHCEQIEAAPVDAEGAVELPHVLPDRPRRRRPELLDAAVRGRPRRPHAQTRPRPRA